MHAIWDEGSQPNFNFINENPKFFNGIAKFTSQIVYKQIFTTFLSLVAEILDVGIIVNAKF